MKQLNCCMMILAFFVILYDLLIEEEFLLAFPVPSSSQLNITYGPWAKVKTWTNVNETRPELKEFSPEMEGFISIPKEVKKLNVTKVKVTEKTPKPKISKTTVKTPQPKILKSTVKTPQPKMLKSTVKTPQPKISKSTVKTPQPKISKSTVKTPQPKISKSTVQPRREVKPTTKQNRTTTKGKITTKK